jgi:hypothetical protein
MARRNPAAGWPDSEIPALDSRLSDGFFDFVKTWEGTGRLHKKIARFRGKRILCVFAHCGGFANHPEVLLPAVSNSHSASTQREANPQAAISRVAKA